MPTKKPDTTATVPPVITPYFKTKPGRPPTSVEVLRQRARDFAVAGAQRRTKPSRKDEHVEQKSPADADAGGSMNITGIVSRKGTYYVRLAIPLDLRKLPQYQKKKEITFSLGTKDPRTAASKGLQKLEALHAEFEAARNNGVSARATNAPVASYFYATVTDELLAMVRNLGETDSRDWVSATRDQITRPALDSLKNLPSEQRKQTLMLAYDQVNQAVQAEWKRYIGLLPNIGQQCDARLMEMSIACPLEDSARRRIHEAFQAGWREGLGQSVQALLKSPAAEIVSAVPLEHSAATAQKNAPTLTDIFELWASQPRRKPLVKNEAELVLKKFIELYGNRPITTVNKSFMRRYQDYLLGIGNSPATVNKKTALIAAMFSLAATKELIDHNPIAGLERVETAAGTKLALTRSEFETNEIELLFQTPPYVGSVMHDNRPMAGYWIPLILAYTGARVSEIAQLRVRDIMTDPEFGLFIHINGEDGGTNKTQSSNRKIPVHKELIRLGFGEYVAAQIENKKEYLFSELPHEPPEGVLKEQDERGRRVGQLMSKYFTRRAKLLGVKEDAAERGESVVLHSLRHNFKTACRDCGIGIEISNEFTGHSRASLDRSSGARYGKVSLYAKRAAMDKLVLSHIPKLDKADFESADQVSTYVFSKMVSASAKIIRARQEERNRELMVRKDGDELDVSLGQKTIDAVIKSVAELKAEYGVTNKSSNVERKASKPKAAVARRVTRKAVAKNS